LVLLIAIAGTVSIIGGFVYSLTQEVISLARNIDDVLDYFSYVSGIISEHLHWMLAFLPGSVEELFFGIGESFMLWIQAQGAVFADSVVGQTVSITTQISTEIISIIIFILAFYFMMTDFPQLAGNLKNSLGPSIYTWFRTLKDVSLSAVGRYLRAQLLLALICFVFMLIGMLIIGQQFALLLALLLAVLDFVPILGTSVVLVPWGIMSIITGELGLGIYLIALAQLFFLIRRLLEPKVMSTQTGLSPLTALLSIYLGMRIGGVFGLIFGPVFAMVFISLYKAGLFKGWVRDIKAVARLHKSN